ncbi:AP-1-like transcription factor [Pleurostoma richardsiae]|uniref:AP-1-like transcription factor n=1 Tax=Pleurostoma richardsiae TaxID=41990 RepID=A0AA38RKF6_9PEZI|nr:AP-1-like transcription factor [Pleurostoma richardsiae]
MTSTVHNPLSDFVLTPQQQNLLFAALNSNKQPTNSPSNNAVNLSPASLNESVQHSDMSGMQESPFLDYDYDFGGDSSFDFDFSNTGQPKMIGDLPGASSSASKPESENNDNPDKRSHPDDDDEDDDGDPKRRESGEKIAKKPGRKPLTTEPSSKRKAQNRAAQRAFRERKEKHLKDLETKVAELEKASETANHENTLLRAQVEKMTVELSQYKKRLSSLATSRSTSQAPSRPFGQPIINNLNDVNFQFEFPKFGSLPGPSPANSSSVNGRTPSAVSTKSPQVTRSPSDHTSPVDKTKGSVSSASSRYTGGLDQQTKDDLAKFSALFTPPMSNNGAAMTSRTSLDSHYSGVPTATSSPSASSNSNSNGAASSSCGTSPEPFNQSPVGFKPVDTMTTIGEEQSTHNNRPQDFGHFASVDMNDFNWLSANNSFQFEPQLFGDYREPQDNILGNGGFDDSFFNDAFDVDFTTPYNMAPSPMLHKKDLISQIDEAKNNDEPIQVGTDGQLLTCNKIWEKLQNCPKVQNGDFDLEGLCSDLQKKAKCSGSGAVVDEKDFKNVMQKYLGKNEKELEQCNFSAVKAQP